MQAVSRPERDAFAFEGAKLLLEFILVDDSVLLFFWRWVDASVGEQVIHGIQKIDLVLLQSIADIAILIAEICVLKPVIELPKVWHLVVNIMVDR